MPLHVCTICGQKIKTGEIYTFDFFPEMKIAGLESKVLYHKTCLEKNGRGEFRGRVFMSTNPPYEAYGFYTNDKHGFAKEVI